MQTHVVHVNAYDVTRSRLTREQRSHNLCFTVQGLRAINSLVHPTFLVRWMDSSLRLSIRLPCDTSLAFRVTLNEGKVRSSCRALKSVDRKLKRTHRILTWAANNKHGKGAIVKQGDPALELPQYAAISNVIQIFEAGTLGLALAFHIANIRSKWAQGMLVTARTSLVVWQGYCLSTLCCRT